MTQQPQVVILPEGAIRQQGKTAQQNNISAAIQVADTVKTTLGPKGMDKMLVDSSGNITVTNDGVTILEQMNVDHPAARMIVEVARTQENEVGDGTTTAVVLAGELLKKAEELINKKLHPTIIVKGYKTAVKKALEELEEFAEPITIKDKDKLEEIASTAMTGKGAEAQKMILAPIVVEAVRYAEDLDDIKIIQRAGGSIEDTELISGIVLNKERLHADMPTSIKDAKIALLTSAIEVKTTDTNANISITNPSQMQEFLKMEEDMIREMVLKVSNSGANVVVCKQGISELAIHLFAKNGVYAISRCPFPDMEKISKATGAKIVSSLDDLEGSLGTAGEVEAKKIGRERLTFINKCPETKSVTILVRGSTEQVAGEVERAITDALGDVKSVIRTGKYVKGAGAPEMFLSMRLHSYAEQLVGREQLAVKAFAEALEIIPTALAENGGFDPIDVLTKMRAKHRKGEIETGVGLRFNTVKEPFQVKTQALSSATEVATMILRIDDIITASGGE